MYFTFNRKYCYQYPAGNPYFSCSWNNNTADMRCAHEQRGIKWFTRSRYVDLNKDTRRDNNYRYRNKLYNTRISNRNLYLHSDKFLGMYLRVIREYSYKQ
jgi:hypothetical protein